MTEKCLTETSALRGHVYVQTRGRDFGRRLLVEAVENGLCQVRDLATGEGYTIAGIMLTGGDPDRAFRLVEVRADMLRSDPT